MQVINTLLGHGIFNALGFTRDDAKWTYGIVAAVILGLVSLGDSVVPQFGIPATWLPFLRLLAFIIGVISASAKTSGLPSGPSADRVDPKNLPAVLLAVALGGGLIALQACASLPVVLTKSYSAVEKSLDTVDDAEWDLCLGTHDVAGLPVAQRSHCTNPLAEPAHLTDALHKSISDHLKAAYDAQLRVGPVLSTWTATTLPKDLQTALDESAQVNALAQALDPQLPDAKNFLDNLKTWLQDLADLKSKILGGAL